MAEIKLLEEVRQIDEFIWPNYENGSIANVPATVAALLGVPFAGLPPLRDELWRPLAGGVKRVVVLIVDAMGWNLLQSERRNGNLEGMLGETAVYSKITSIFPSTTAAVLSSYWTGSAPAQHSLIGLNLFFPEHATAAQMLKFTPVFGKYPDALIDAGTEPENFLQTAGFGEQLHQSGIPTYSFKGHEIVDSVLSKMHGRGVEHNIGVQTVADMMSRIRQVLEENPGKPMVINGYWPTIDMLSHVYTWQGDSVRAELRAIFAQLKCELLDSLSKAAAKDTVLFVVADHGQALTPPSQHIELDDHPLLKQMLFMRPIGEPRVAYLYAKHGQQQNILAYINQYLSHAMVAVNAEDALASGLFGPQPFAANIKDRIGDVVVITRKGYVLLSSKEMKKADILIGRHGSMTRAEMEVPWLGFRLDR